MVVDDRQQNMKMTGTNVQYDAALDLVLDGAFDGPCHRYPLRVHYEDTDAGGVIYHAQYLAFAERARSAWLRCLGVNQPAMLVDENLGFVVRRIEIDFLLPPKLRFRGTVAEQWSMFFYDPFNNGIEFKSFENSDLIFQVNE